MFLSPRKNLGNPIGLPPGAIVENIGNPRDFGRNGVGCAVAHIPAMESRTFIQILDGPLDWLG